MWEIELYETENGKIPVNVFIKSTSLKMQAKIIKEIEMLAKLGTDLRLPHTKPLGDGLFELRISCDGNISRVIYFHYVNHKFVLLHGFIKKTEKTPQREIDTAKSCMKDYRRRNR